MGKQVSAKATFSPTAARLFADKATRRELTKQILAGADVIHVAGVTALRRPILDGTASTFGAYEPGRLSRLFGALRAWWLS